jgi:hypothetical protein
LITESFTSRLTSFFSAGNKIVVVVVVVVIIIIIIIIIIIVIRLRVSEIRVLRVSGHKRKWQKGGENYVLKSFVTCTLQKYY